VAKNRSYTKDEEAWLTQRRDFTPTELEEQWPFTFERTGHALQRHRERLLERNRDAMPAKLPASPKPLCTDPIRLAGPSACILTDLHVPFHNAAFVEDVVALAKEWDIKDCIIGGDLIDVEAFSKWVGDPENTFEEELDLAEKILDELASAFDRVVWTLGNHEARFLGKAAQRQIRSQRFLRMVTNAKNVEISSFEWCELDTPQGLYRIVHPKNASIVSGRVPSVIASRRFTDSHVIGAHGHLVGQVRTEDGKRWAIDSGTCADIDRLQYSTKSVSTRPVMNNGAVIVVEGFPYLVTPTLIGSVHLANLYAQDA
jgi:hypothetical protein